MDKEVIIIYPKLTRQHLQEKPILPGPALALAGPLEKNGFKVQILDEHVEDVHDHLTRLKSSPVCFGISCMVGYQIESGLKIASTIRNLKPDCTIVWGGWFPTLLPRTTITDSNVDIVVRGKGEIIFLEVVKTIFEGRSLQEVKGILFKRNGQIIETPDRPLDNPNIFPKRPYHLLDLSRYCVSEGIVNYTSSYGCPFRCRFCGISVGLQRKWNGGLKPERVLDEIEELVKDYGIKHIIFHEDNFCFDRRRAKEILKGFIERDLKITWEANTRIDQMVRFDPEMLRLIKDSGCFRLFAGVESAVQAMLDFLQKDITVEQIEKSVELAKEYDLPFTMNIIAGLPKETPAGFMETLRKIKSFLEHHRKLSIVIYQYAPVPGTPLFEFEKQEGRVYEPGSLEEWAEATKDLSLNLFDYNKKIVKYTNRIYRVMTFYFQHAYLSRNVKKDNQSKTLRILLNILSRLSAFRFQYALWGFPIEWELYKVLRKFKIYLKRI